MNNGEWGRHSPLSFWKPANLAGPVPLYPEIPAWSVVPVTRYPAGVCIGRSNIGPGNPYVSPAVPAVISRMPSPVWVRVRWWRHDLASRCRGTDANVNLRHCGRGNRKHRRKGDSKQLLSHVVTPSKGHSPCYYRSDAGTRLEVVVKNHKRRNSLVTCNSIVLQTKDITITQLRAELQEA